MPPCIKDARVSAGTEDDALPHRFPMTQDAIPDDQPASAATVERPPLSAAAKRALEEAAARRAEIDARAAEIALKRERQGRGGLEPVRYADWEVKGIAVDF